jgi:chromosome segregation ATPase
VKWGEGEVRAVAQFDLVHEHQQLLRENQELKLRLAAVHAESAELSTSLANDEATQQLRDRLRHIHEQTEGFGSVATFTVQYQVNIGQLVQQVTNLTIENTSLRHQLDVVTGELSKVRGEVACLQSEVRELKQAVTELQSANTRLRAKHVMGELEHLLQKWMLAKVTGSHKREKFSEFMERQLTDDESKRWEEVLAIIGEGQSEYLWNVCQAFEQERGDVAHDGKVDLSMEEYEELLEIAVADSKRQYSTLEAGRDLLRAVHDALGDTPFAKFTNLYEAVRRAPGRRY